MKSIDFLSPGKYVSRKLEPLPVCTNPSEESIRMRAAQESATGSLKGQQMLDIRKKLPSWKEKDKLLRIIEKNQVRTFRLPNCVFVSWLKVMVLPMDRSSYRYRDLHLGCGCLGRNWMW